MAIQVSCARCGTDFRIKDELAGRRFRCSTCQAAVSAPERPSEDDPWDLSDEDYGEAIPDPPEEESRPAPRKKKRATRKSRSSGGMPASVMIAMCCTGLVFCIIILGVIGCTVAPNGQQVIVPLLVRFGINIGIVLGLKNRSSSWRTGSVALSALGLFFMGVTVFAAPEKLIGDAGGMEQQIAAVIATIQSVLWIVNIIALLTPSASEWCSE